MSASTALAKPARLARLVLIRHGESERNKAKKGAVYFADEAARSLVKGVPDYKIALTPLGWEQAAATGAGLREQFGVPHCLYHSGYRRTVETAEAIVSAYPEAERARIDVRNNPFIRERDAGYTYDMTTAEAEAAFPWLREYWQTFGGFFARPPGGESLADVVNRVYGFLTMLVSEGGGETVFVVTHAEALGAFRFLLEQWSYDEVLHWPEGRPPRNCGVTDYRYDPGAGRLVLQNYNVVHWREADGRR